MNNKRVNFKWTYIFLILILAFAVVLFFADTSNKKDKLITAQEAIVMIQNDQISDMYACGNEVKLKKANDSVVENAKDFPNKYDFYIDAVADDIRDIKDAINAKNVGKQSTDAGYINYNIEPVGDSIFDILMPILYVGFAIFIVILIFRMFSSNGKGAMSFGKSRAKASANIKVRFSDIAGADEEKAELAEIVEFLKTPQKFTELGARIPKGVLLVGNPGTGKTLLARAVAGESNAPFLSISGSDFVEMFVGVGASRVRDLFEQAKRNAPCIVFIDEIDAVGRQRGAGLGGGNDEREQTLNQLLVEMDGFEANEGIIVLAATNRADVLDPALLRPGRFDRQVYVHLPDVKGREGIIKIHAKNKPLDSEVDFKTLARITSGFTGADLENMLNEAAILAARAGRPKILMQDITEGINKVIMGPQKKSLVVTDRDKKITAYHESGHAILGKKLKYCEEVQEVSIIPRGMAAGYTMSRPDTDDSHMTYNKLNDMIAMTMGGRIAEELYMEDISTGASNDIKKATELARKMVTEWGMSDKFGFMNLGESQEVFIGRDYQTKAEYSEQTAGEIDAEVKKILDRNYARAKKILKENEETIHLMSSILLEKETIYKDEVDMIIDGKTKEEILDHMQIEEKNRKTREDSYRKEIEVARKIKDIENKTKTAEMYFKNGIISKDDYEKILAQKELAVKEIKEKSKPKNEPVEVVKSEPSKQTEDVPTPKKITAKKADEVSKPRTTKKSTDGTTKSTTKKSSKKVEENKDEH